MNEKSIKNQLIKIIRNIIEKINNETWSEKYISQLKLLIDELDKPCVVALAGEVSSGKSSLINAILGGDYAKTAVTETTALLTYFKYGNPEKNRQVKRVYTDGSSSYGDLSLLKEGHGNQEESLDITIDFVEAEIKSDVLKQIILVDTPGTGSTLDVHNANLLKILKNNNQKSITSYKRADALLYVFKYFGKQTNQDTITEFQSATESGKHPVNILGIVNKIDIDEKVLSAPYRFTEKIEKQFDGKLNHVVPVSSQIYSAIKNMSQAKLVEIKEKVDKIDISEIEELTDNQSFFEEEDEDLPDFFNAKYRKSICKDFGENRKFNWIVFKRIICFIRSFEGPKNELKKSLIEYSRFEDLMDNIKVNILDRSKLIVYYKVTSELKKMLVSEVFQLKKRRIKAEEDIVERKRKFLHFLSAFKSPVALDLIDFIKHSSELVYPKNRSMTWIKEVRNDIDSLIDLMDILNIDLIAEGVLKNKYDELNEKEKQELKTLFGLKGETLNQRLDIFTSREVDFFDRVSYWKAIMERTKIGSSTRKLSSLAVDSYLKMIDFKNRKENGNNKN